MTHYRERLEAGEFDPPAGLGIPEPGSKRPAMTQSEALASMTAEELREALAERGLPTSGSKADLRARLEGGG